MKLKATKIKVPRLGANRHGVYYLRYPVLDDSGRRKVVQRSLLTKDPAVAKIAALEFSLSLIRREAEYAGQSSRLPDQIAAASITARCGSLGAPAFNRSPELALAAVVEPPTDPSVARPITGSPQGLPSSGIRLAEVIEMHLVEEARRLKPGATTINEKRSIFAEFVAFFDNAEIQYVTSVDINTRWRPAEYSRVNGKHQGRATSLARLEKRRGYIHRLFAWAIQTGRYQGENPMAVPMAAKSEIRRHEKPYEEFTSDDIKLLFSEDYRQEMKAPDWYWTPLVAMYSGARLSEIAHRKLDDFVEIEGYKVMLIPDAKTRGGRRTVPLHSDLLGLGFWQYVEALKARGCDRLFPHRPELKSEKMAGRSWSVWVKRRLKNGANKSFHSIRSTVITDLHNRGANAAAIHRVSGHTTTAVSGVHGKYVRSINLAVQAETIQVIKHEGLDPALLKLPDPTFKSYLDHHLSHLQAAEALRQRAARRQDLINRSRAKTA